jgi:hypothetical protein
MNWSWLPFWSTCHMWSLLRWQERFILLSANFGLVVMLTFGGEMAVLFARQYIVETNVLIPEWLAVSMAWTGAFMALSFAIHHLAHACEKHLAE